MGVVVGAVEGQEGRGGREMVKIQKKNVISKKAFFSISKYHFQPEQIWLSISEFLVWTFPSLDLDMAFIANRDVSLLSKIECQTKKILMRQLITSCLIWIYTVCKDICFGLKH